MTANATPAYPVAMLTTTIALILVAPLPSLHDRDRFPPAEACHDAIRAQLVRWSYARHRLATELHRADHWRREIAEADRAMEAWYWLLAAQGGLAEERGGDDSPETCRDGLARLRELIGEEAYFTGRMP